MMRVLILVIAMFIHLSVAALTCDGEGYSLSISDGTATLDGPDVSTTSDLVSDQGNYFTANFNSGNVRSLSVAVFAKRMTLVTTRGVKIIKVNCSF